MHCKLLSIYLYCIQIVNTYKVNKIVIDMANKILVFNGDKTKLMLEFKCSQPTVSVALNGKETTALHINIRKRALEMGGEEVMPVKRVYEIVQDKEER